MAAELHSKAETLPAREKGLVHRGIQDLIKTGTTRRDHLTALWRQCKNKTTSPARIDLNAILELKQGNNEILQGVSDLADTFETRPDPTPMPVMQAEGEHDTFMPTENASFVTVNRGTS